MKQVNAFQDNKGKLHPTPMLAAISDMETIVDPQNNYNLSQSFYVKLVKNFPRILALSLQYGIAEGTPEEPAVPLPATLASKTKDESGLSLPSTPPLKDPEDEKFGFNPVRKRPLE